MKHFDYYDWENGYLPDPLPGEPRLPAPPDTYRPRPTSGIRKDGRPVSFERGRSIQCSRAAKARETNRAFFVKNVLPILRGHLDIAQGLSLSYAIADFSIAREMGWKRWTLGDRASWIHETDTDKLSQARAMGATPSA